ncbi:MAG TPA: hypothetical protein VFJ91_04315 [Gaiellaceae bacterium]|nr:hypothetical protein [Gaiellaceae bacterium]
MASRTRSSNHRASLAVLAGVVSAATVPAAVLVAQRSATLDLVDAAWAIPLGFVTGAAALLLARGAAGAWTRSLERAGGARRIRTARILAVAGLSLTLAAAIAVGFYELLVRLEG